MPLPKAIRRLTPDPIRNSPNLGGLALGAGLIPPRTMHAPAEAVREEWDIWHPHVRRGGYVAFRRALGGSAGPTAVVDELFHAGQVDGWHITDEVGTVVALQRS
jgi:hypothetical protein